MTREVHAPDGRLWMVHREINWAKPAQAQEFEHDVAAGQVGGGAMMAIVVFMMLALVWWKPEDAAIPGWLVLVLLVVALLVALQWALARPWTIVATTYEPVETSGEQWAGTVRGLMASAREVSRIARNLERDAMPDDGRGPLQKLS